MRPLRQHWATVAGNCAQHCHLPPLVHYLPVSPQWRVKVVVCVRCGLHDNLAWLATLTPAPVSAPHGHCLLVSSWKMKDAEPDKIYEDCSPWPGSRPHTLHTIYLSSNEAAETQFFKASCTCTENVCVCIFISINCHSHPFSSRPSRFIMSSNCPGGERQGEVGSDMKWHNTIYWWDD